MNNDITYTKAVGILLMVLCHSMFWDIPVVYMFHMPLFFFFSGYCLKEKYYKAPHLFLYRKIKGIWLPYVKYSVLFLFLHNVMYSLNIYSSSYGYMGRTSSLYIKDDILSHLSELLIRMQGQEQLLGGYWFLKALFFGSIISFIGLWMMRMVSEKLKLKYSCCALFGGAFLVIGCLALNLIDRPISILCVDVTCLMAAVFFWVGHLFAIFEIKKFGKVKMLLSIFVVALGSYVWPMKMGMPHYQMLKLIPYIISAVLGTWCIYSVSWERMGKKAALLLQFVGMSTLTILTWHFLAFKIVSLIIVEIYALPMARLAEFPVISEYAWLGWWIAYFFVAIFTSCCIAYCNKWIKYDFLKL